MRRWRIDCLFIMPEVIDCTWLAPSQDEVMVNIDGSKSDNSGGFGAVIRDFNADVLSAACGGSPVISVLSQELQGAELGMNLAILKNQLRIHLSTDSMAVYNLFTSPNPSPLECLANLA